MNMWDTRFFQALPQKFSQVDAPFVTDVEQERAFFDVLGAVVANSPFAEEADCLQHGTTTILLHSIAVAHVSRRVARKLGWTDHLDELERAALLHDFFLYNWHEPGPGREMHAFMHATRAMRNARRFFPDLSEREADAIRNHMFPLTPVPPRFREGWLVTYADKWCATYETTLRRGQAYPRLRELCAFYLPQLRLDLPRTQVGPGRGGSLPLISARRASASAGRVFSAVREGVAGRLRSAAR